MKKLQFYRQAILIVSAITLLAAGCTKEKSVLSERDSGVSKQLWPTDLPTQQPILSPLLSGELKGYISPAPLRAPVLVSIYNSLYSQSVNADPNTGLYHLWNIPAGVYTVEATPMIDYGLVGVKVYPVIIRAGRGRILNIRLH